MTIAHALAVAAGLSFASAGSLQPPTAPPPAMSEAAPGDPVIAALMSEADAVRPLVESDLARAFLDTARQLPPITPRVIYRNPATRAALTEAQFEALPEDAREGFTKRTYDTRFYYTTGYGSPMIYARPLDLLARHGLASLRDRRVMDFGYGMIGQGRMMALLGADVHGVDVEPLFALLYSEPGDTGEMAAADGARGRLSLHHGQWPASDLGMSRGFDAIVSKNVLKAGYIHPAREADPSRLVHLGVSDEEFLAAVHAALKPGGLFLVYNISPPQAPEDKPYLPHADGGFPFERGLVDRLGFEVLAWDATDDDAMQAIFAALDPAKTKADFEGGIFTRYTVLRRPAAAGPRSHDQP